jgi:hypothetical protein
VGIVVDRENMGYHISHRVCRANGTFKEIQEIHDIPTTLAHGAWATEGRTREWG